jgi:hypothetical protein
MERMRKEVVASASTERYKTSHGNANRVNQESKPIEGAIDALRSVRSGIWI